MGSTVMSYSIGWILLWKSSIGISKTGGGGSTIGVMTAFFEGYTTCEQLAPTLTIGAIVQILCLICIVVEESSSYPHRQFSKQSTEEVVFFWRWQSVHSWVSGCTGTSTRSIENAWRPILLTQKYAKSTSMVNHWENRWFFCIIPG